MKSLKNIAALAAAAALSLTIASCAGSGAPSPDAAPSGADTPIEELVKVNGVAVRVDPGTYTVDVQTEDAVGTIWIFAYDSDAVDYENMDAEQIVDFLLGQIS